MSLLASKIITFFPFAFKNTDTFQAQLELLNLLKYQDDGEEFEKIGEGKPWAMILVKLWEDYGCTFICQHNRCSGISYWQKWIQGMSAKAQVKN